MSNPDYLNNFASVGKPNAGMTLLSCCFVLKFNIRMAQRVRIRYNVRLVNVMPHKKIVSLHSAFQDKAMKRSTDTDKKNDEARKRSKLNQQRLIGLNGNGGDMSQQFLPLLQVPQQQPPSASERHYHGPCSFGVVSCNKHNGCLETY